MSLFELLVRFLLLTFSVLFLYFFSNRKNKAAINPLIIVVGFCTFSLCYLFTKVEIGIGIGFGLFAIFSILRFRAQTFSLNAIIFLFATITMSILDIMYPFEKYEVLLFFQLSIVLFYILGSLMLLNDLTADKKSCKLILKYDEFYAAEALNRKAKIEEIVQFAVFDFEIITINRASNEVEVLIFY
jgi:prepilin signal peptidase PulO-like enzyme (type II secretory pathway)